MAIALDATAVSTDQSASPLTWNHTCTGSNLLLVVGITCVSQNIQPTVTAVTYNGVSMTKARGDQRSLATAETESSIWLLHGPSTGSNQISATITNVGHAAGGSASYTGAQQSDTADAVNGNTGTATGSQTVTLTTVSDNTWLFAVGVNAATVGPTMAANQTSRGTVSLASSQPSVLRIEDTNGPKSPAGSYSIGMTVGATAGEQDWALSAASFAPAGAAPPATNSVMAMMGVG